MENYNNIKRRNILLLLGVLLFLLTIVFILIKHYDMKSINPLEEIENELEVKETQFHSIKALSGGRITIGDKENKVIGYDIVTNEKIFTLDTGFPIENIIEFNG